MRVYLECTRHTHSRSYSLISKRASLLRTRRAAVITRVLNPCLPQSTRLNQQQLILPRTIRDGNITCNRKGVVVIGWSSTSVLWWLPQSFMSKLFIFFFLMIRPPPRSPLFPYTPLSRSSTPPGRAPTRGPRPGTAPPGPFRQRRTPPAPPPVPTSACCPVCRAARRPPVPRSGTTTSTEIGRAHV